MRSQRSFHRSLIVLLVVLLSPVIEAGAPPPLSGTVVELVDGGKFPLDQARVELLVPSSGEVKHHSYTDNQGLYAFRSVEPGPYQVRVRLGKRVLEQVVDNEVRSVRRIDLPSQPARLDITVRTGRSR